MWNGSMKRINCINTTARIPGKLTAQSGLKNREKEFMKNVCLMHKHTINVPIEEFNYIKLKT
jgi:hypothetical protein